jgi:ABC-type multidrug transport system fused ATPase/permease subunit
VIALEAVQLTVGYGLAALLVISHITRHPESSALLLLAYWGLNIPVLGRELAGLACQYPLHRNVALRVLEPLNALEEQPGKSMAEPRGARTAEEVDSTDGIAISACSVSAEAGGHTVLHDITMDIEAGAHVAIVGPSGAGKSSLVGMLLGFRAPASGSITINGQGLSSRSLDWLRRRTVWIDPTVHLWSRSLLENLRYGLASEPLMPVGQAIEDAELTGVLEKLPDGLQTRLGDSGGLLSGGEGQRARVARAFLRPGIRLVIMDEPFRGLDGGARRRLLEAARRLWQRATILFVTHDLADAQTFDRVLVMDNGTIIEDGPPEMLAGRRGSRYQALLSRGVELKQSLTKDADWRRLRMRDGMLSEETVHKDLSSEHPTVSSQRFQAAVEREKIA